MLLPWIVTSATWPRCTSFKKSEKASVACGPRLDEVWNRLKSATRSSPMTIQRARFLPKLFTMNAFPYRAGHRASRDYPSRAGPATIFARFTDKTRTVLNNGKARLRQWIDRSKYNLRQADDSVTPILQMRNGCDALLVPHGRKNGEEQAGQPDPPQLRSAAIEPRGSGEAQISDCKAAAGSLRGHNPKPPIPDDPLARAEPERWRGFGEFARHQDTISPDVEAAPAQCMRAPFRHAQHFAQPSNAFAPRRISRAADRCRNRGKQPVRHLARIFRQRSGVQHREPCGVQGYMSGKENVPLVLAGNPGAAQCTDVAEQRRNADPRGRRVVALPQPRPFEGGVEIARIAYEGLALGFEQRHEPRPRDTEQRTQQSALRKLADRGHPGEPVGAAVSSAANQIRLDLVIPMMAGQQVQAAVRETPVAKQTIARKTCRLLDAGSRLFARPDQYLVANGSRREPGP